MSRIQFQFQSPEWKAYYTGQEDVINLLGETFHYTSSWHDSVETHIQCLYVCLNSQELPIRYEYVGPNESMWDWYSS